MVCMASSWLHGIVLKLRIFIYYNKRPKEDKIEAKEDGTRKCDGDDKIVSVCICICTTHSGRGVFLLYISQGVSHNVY